MALALSPVDAHGTDQRVFYDKGVGTGQFDRVLGGVFGWGISDKIQTAYRFVVEEYELGDQLFFFGFSRGAYAVRSLAGLIRNCGVLRRTYRHKVSDAYNLYRRRDAASHPVMIESQLFRKTYSYEVRIHFIGVWETVGELGIPVGIPWLPLSWVHYLNKRWEFHDVDLSSYVDNAYQAIAIDEKRPQYAPTLWHQQAHARGRQTLRQVWFAGVHKNVGGGYPDPGLSDLAFIWIAEHAANCGLWFDANYLEHAMHPDILGKIRDSKTGLFKLFPDADRQIGKGDATFQSVRYTAVERMRLADYPPYHPANLIEYLDTGGEVT